MGFIRNLIQPSADARRSQGGFAFLLIFAAILLFAALTYLINQTLSSSSQAVSTIKGRSEDLRVMENVKQVLLSTTVRTDRVGGSGESYSVTQLNPDILQQISGGGGCAAVKTSLDASSVFIDSRGRPICVYPFWFTGFAGYDLGGIGEGVPPNSGLRNVEGQGNSFMENGGLYAAFAIMTADGNGDYPVENSATLDALRNRTVATINNDINAGNLNFGFAQIVQSYKDMAITSGATKLELVTTISDCRDPSSKLVWNAGASEGFECVPEYEEIAREAFSSLTTPTNPGDKLIIISTREVNGVTIPVFDKAREYEGGFRYAMENFIDEIYTGAGPCVVQFIPQPGGPSAQQIIDEAAYFGNFDCVGIGSAPGNVVSVGGGVPVVRDSAGGITFLRSISGTGGISVSIAPGNNEIVIDGAGGGGVTAVGVGGHNTGGSLGHQGNNANNFPFGNRNYNLFEFRDVAGVQTLYYNLDNLFEAAGIAFQRSPSDPSGSNPATYRQYGGGFDAEGCINSSNPGDPPRKLLYSSYANGSLGGFICSDDDRGYWAVADPGSAAHTAEVGPAGPFTATYPVNPGQASGTAGTLELNGYLFRSTDFNVVRVGPVYQISTTPPSDRRFKKDIAPYQPSALDLLGELNIVSFHWDPNGVSSVTGTPMDKINSTFFSDREQVGLIAQHVKDIYPEFVTGSEEEGYGVKYDRIVPFLIKGVQEIRAMFTELMQSFDSLSGQVLDQQARIETLESEVAALKAEIEALKAMMKESSTVK